MERNSSLPSNRWLVLAVVVLLPFMATLDSTIINVALPVMEKSLAVNMSTIQLIAVCYLITIVCTILFFGRLGDIHGKSIVFNMGLLTFTFGSLMCGFSRTFMILVLSRIIQAIGASAAMANNQGIITQVFPAAERGRALGISSTFIALGTLLGPPLGGIIVTYLSWHYIFLINIPIGFIAVIIGFRILPKTQIKTNEKIDFIGAFILTISLMLLFFSLLTSETVGFTNFLILITFFAAILSLIFFVFIEKNITKPLIDVSLFKNSLFSVGIICTFICYMSINSSNILQPFYLEYVLKLAPNLAGLVMMTYPLVLTIISPLSGYLSDKFGPEPLTFVGLIFISLGLYFMSTLKENTSIKVLCIYVSILAVGNGMFLTPNNSIIMSTAPQDKLGIAGSINAFIRNLGQSSGISMATMLLYRLMSLRIGKRVLGYVEGRSDVFIFGMKYVYICAAFMCFLGVLLTSLRLVKRMLK